MKNNYWLLGFAVAATLLTAATTKVRAQGTTPDPAIMQGSIIALQNQRNAALDTAASYEAMIRVLQSQLADAQKKVKDLEAKVPKEEPKEPETDQKKTPPG